ncbi:UDP-glucose 4-epimerase GalE [Pseudothauera nasutitermitis]|uniref:UDP-glucose 4-epimerase n=1 Tax=Pseudothauera nasutitermitis TaxID=2565930 RepID=A0A4S4AV54_9RHOO|nr:UDP-glucose 4-epimerase GalE [Pseudothauera nasutitermitis]THF63879.1 UDP-glucose 4-epimerase GalE [Pseudothauera nasutitermitis]
MASVLVTGGAGYIGSHTCLAALQAGHRIIVVDNLSNASAESLRRVEQLSGRGIQAFHQVDVRDREALEAVFRTHQIEVVIHFAGLKAVGESVQRPLAYYDNNVCGTRVLLEVMAAHEVRRIVFSSSATVYGDPARVPLAEDATLAPANPYGRSKWMVEQMLADLAASDPRWHAVALRYFNPVGAHESGRIGEDPVGVPNNLMPYVAQVAVGRLAELRVFGNDYPTPDGTGVRDYIHVVDLAAGHLHALERIGELPGATAINLGTGQGYSVLEVVRAFERASGRPVPYRVVERRPGDVAQCWADPLRAQRLLGWCAQRGLEDICADAWRWQAANPDGYRNAATG